VFMVPVILPVLVPMVIAPVNENSMAQDVVILNQSKIRSGRPKKS